MLLAEEIKRERQKTAELLKQEQEKRESIKQRIASLTKGKEKLVYTNNFGFVSKKDYDSFSFLQRDNGVPMNKNSKGEMVLSEEYLLWLRRGDKRYLLDKIKEKQFYYDDDESMTATITKIHEPKKSNKEKYGEHFIRIEFDVDGSWAKTDICLEFKNYKHWKDIINKGVGTMITNFHLKKQREIDSDSQPIIIKKYE